MEKENLPVHTEDSPAPEQSGSPGGDGRKNLLLIVGVVLLAAMLLVVSQALPSPRTEEDCVVIRVGNEEYARIPLSQPQTVTVTQENGAVNVVEVTQRGMIMLSSTCKNQVCVHKGEVTLDNWELKGGAFIACLPNQVMLELLEKQE
ncbi:MAG: NusG domain II-containing protein [Clostridia bacterium]|nr:NusG domain II-containing protein [Clostridia bacterium]